MKIELTEEQRRVLQEQTNGPVEVVDPSTQRTYVLVSREQYERLRSLLPTEAVATDSTPPLPEIPPGVRKSWAALRRDLPSLLAKRRLRGQWAAYYGDERIGIARNEVTLIRECQARGLSGDSYYIGLIHPPELIEVEEIEDPKPEHFMGYDETVEWLDSTSPPPA